MSDRGHLVVKLLASPLQVEGRVVAGWASTVDVDRDGDVVVPNGMEAKLPLPLLWNHDTNQIIGSITDVKAHAKGVRITARLVEGTARADEAWALIKQHALTSFSIGFRGLKSEPIPGGNRRWTSWSLVEVSAVATPANPNALIDSISNAKQMAAPKKVTGHFGVKEMAQATVTAVHSHIGDVVKMLRKEIADATSIPDVDGEDSAVAYRWFEFTKPKSHHPKYVLSFPLWKDMDRSDEVDFCKAAIPPDVSQTVEFVFPEATITRAWSAPMDWSDAPHEFVKKRKAQLMELLERKVFAQVRAKNGRPSNA